MAKVISQLPSGGSVPKHNNLLGLNEGDYLHLTQSEKAKLDGIQSGAEVNVNADWNAISGDAQILNKPTSFPPSTHTHTISEVINLQNELNSKENISNKVNIISGNSSTEYPTEKAVVDYVSSQIGADFAKVVYFDNVTPNVASIFDLNNPPLVNDPSLKEDVANLYIGTDASTWVYVTSPAGYVTKTVTSSGSNFYITGTNTDAGSIKTGSITKKGQIVIDSEINNDSGLTLKKLPQTTTNISVITRSTSPANLYYLYSKTPTMLWGIDVNSGQIYKMTNRSYTPTLVSTQGGCRSMTINTDGFIYLTRDRQSPGGRITKLDVNGVFQEDVLFNFTNNDTFGERGLYIANDNSGNLYVSGFYDKTGGGQYRNFLIKLTTTGTVLHIFREDTTTTSISNTVLIKSKTEDVIYSYDVTSTTIQKITPSTNAIADFITLPSTGYSIGTGYNGEIWTVKGTLLTVYNNIGTVIKTTDFVGIPQDATQTIIPSYDGFALMNRVTATSLYELVDVQTVQHKILKTDSLGKVVKATNLQDVEYAPIAHTHTVSQITDFPTFKTIEGQSIIGAGNIDLDKASVGLGNVDNTSDLNKIISTATQTALNDLQLNKEDKANKQNSLDTDATGTKYPTVTAVNTALALKATNENVVHKTENETIFGIKTFKDAVIIDNKALKITGDDSQGYNQEVFFGINSEGNIEWSVTDINSDKVTLNFNVNNGLNFNKKANFLGTVKAFPATLSNEVVVKSQLDAESDSQIEISANSNTLDAWNKKTILFTANCTITVPATLLSQYGFVFRTLAGVTVTWQITAPFTWETTPTTTPEKTTGSFMRRGNTNTILLDF